MRRETSKERAAWTEFVDGKKTCVGERRNKMGNRRVLFNGKWYASQLEANWAAKFQALASRGQILHYQEQKRITLVPGNGKLRPVVYVADFYYVELDGTPHVLDAKGFKTQMYRLKKRMAALLLRIEIEELN
jgi:hypothetical protein